MPITYSGCNVESSQLSFQNLEIEESGDCTSDYVTVHRDVERKKEIGLCSPGAQLLWFACGPSPFWESFWGIKRIWLNVLSFPCTTSIPPMLLPPLLLHQGQEEQEGESKGHVTENMEGPHGVGVRKEKCH